MSNAYFVGLLVSGILSSFEFASICILVHKVEMLVRNESEAKGKFCFLQIYFITNLYTK